MSSLRLLLVGILAAGALSAIASAPAAAECPTGGTITTLCIKGNEAAEGGKADLHVHCQLPVACHMAALSTILGHLTCLSSAGGEVLALVNIIQGKETVDVKMDLTTLASTGCEIEAQPKCAVVEPVAVKASTGELKSNHGVVLTPNEKEEFMTIEITNKGTEKCPATLLGKHKFTGTQECKFPNIEKSAKEHEFECPESGSKLKEGEKEAKFLLEVVKGELEEPKGEEFSIGLT